MSEDYEDFHIYLAEKEREIRVTRCPVHIANSADRRDCNECYHKEYCDVKKKRTESDE